MASTIVPLSDPQLKKNVADLFGDAAALVHDAWRIAVAEIADKAKAKLPECAGRVDSAVKLVLAGDVDLQADGSAKVASQSNGSMAYHVMNGHCNCKDYPKAPHSFCKHRLGAAIARRAHELTKFRLIPLDNASNGHAPTALEPVQPTPDALEPGPAPAPALPEAPVSITLKATLHGHEVMVTLRGVDFASVKTQVEQASQWLSVQAPGQPPTQPPRQASAPPAHDDSPYCHQHKTALKRYTKDGRSWYSHKTTDGRWCKGQ